MFSLNCVGVFVLHFIVRIFGLNTKKLHFLSFELHTIVCIVKYLVSSDEAVPAKCFRGLIRMFNKCSQNVLIELLGVFVLHFIVRIFGLNTKKLHFLSFELHTIVCIYLVSSDEAVPAKC